MTRTLLLLLLLLALAGCSTPLPAERADYAGLWRTADTRLLITPQGRVEFVQSRGNGFQKSLKAPLKRFDGDNFVVGLGPISTTFVVSRRPQRGTDGRWTMTVDGVEYARED
ncbi:hypothetical protein [Tahibacter sp.]|uniref:hypothetical protein n=1 Tax=Tahibacter sp. TaxID=2056211 RepID=UPI0028C4F1BE|nr:hypothetical protein [Tahibacter sp.]